MPSNDDAHGIENEPHLSPASNSKNHAEPVRQGELSQADVDSNVDHSIWDEPSFNSQLAGPPPQDALTFRNWMMVRSSQWTAGQSWFFTLMLIIANGPAALLAFLLMLMNLGWLTPIVVCVFSPLVQELCKIALPLWVVERRPYYFKSGFQIVICSLSSGLVFGTVSGVMAISNWIEFSVPVLALVFAAHLIVHLICSLIAALGLFNIWKRPTFLFQPASLPDGASSFITAFMIHALFATSYYLLMIFVEVSNRVAWHVG